MEKITVTTKNGRKEIEVEAEQDMCFNCEKITEDGMPTEDSAIHFCPECYYDFYCLKCGKPLEDGEIMYHKECLPVNIQI